MANFGVGFGAFMNGLAQGAQTAQSIKANDQKQQLVDMQLQDLKDQQASKQTVRDISQQGIQDANANTDGSIQNVTNYYMKNVVPKIQQEYLAKGDVKTAKAFGDWVQDANVQEGMKYGANLIRAAQLNDVQGVSDNLVKLYNQPGYFEDGRTAVSSKILTGKDGQPSGMEVVLRNDKTGQEETKTFNSMKDVYDVAMQFAQPDQVFKYGMNQIAEGQKTAAEMAKEGREWQRTVQGKQLDQNYRLEADNNRAQLKMAEETAKAKNPTNNKKVTDAQATIQFLKQNGASDDYIRANLAGIIGIENRSRPLSSRIDDYIKMRTESDSKFRKMSTDDQIAEARSYISTVDKQTAGDGFTLGMPGVNTGQTQQQPQNNGVPVLDTKTGQIIYR